jgi:von Willebrand factor type A domain
MKRLRSVLLVAFTGLLVVGAGAASGTSTPVAHAARCAPATNIEAIIDDSGSMFVTDPDILRVEAVKLLINTLSPRTALGAVEFGGTADTLFAPEAVGPNASAMGTAMDTKVKADNGGTDYNAAFAQSDQDNPNAQARIFLTDGGHDIGTYNNGHLVHKVPTYVISFSSGISSGDRSRLRGIASSTGGTYYPQTDSSHLQSVMNSIGAAVTCQTPPRSFNDQLKQGASKSHTVAIGARTKSIQVALTWSSPLDRFAISHLRLVSHGKIVAAAARVRKLKIKSTKTATFTVLTVTGLSKGTLRFSVKAAKIGSHHPKVTLTTQVRQSRAK